jgi:hypothetical protein
MRAAFFAVTALIACTRSPAPAPDGMTMATTSTSAPTTSETFRGIALDVKGGLRLRAPDGVETWVEGIATWPEGCVGKSVDITGILVTKHGPSCVHDPLPCQGIAGPYRAIEVVSIRCP